MVTGYGDPTDLHRPELRTTTMHSLAKRHGTATAAAPRAGEAARVKCLMANTSWSIRSYVFMPTADHEIGPRRLTVIPTC